MAKITVTIPEGQLDRLRAMVAAGQVASVSAYVQDAIRSAFSSEADWESMLDEILEQTGGPMTESECAWAESVVNATPASAKLDQSNPKAA